jgi:hypothetical protein
MRILLRNLRILASPPEIHWCKHIAIVGVLEMADCVTKAKFESNGEWHVMVRLVVVMSCAHTQNQVSRRVLVSPQAIGFYTLTDGESKGQKIAAGLTQCRLGL